MGAKYAKRQPPPAPRQARTRGNPLTTTPDYDADEFEFLKAVEKYKRDRKRPFPSYTECLAILKSLGWRKVPPAEGR